MPIVSITLTIDLVVEQPIEVRGGVDGETVNRHEELPGLDRARQRGRSQRQHLGDLQPAALLVLERVEAQAEPSGGGRDLPRRRVDAEVRGVQLANHLRQHAAHLVGGAGAGHARSEAPPRVVPVHAVHGRVEEVVAHQRPRLVEHLHLLGGEVDVEFRGDVDAPRLAAFDRRDTHGPFVEVVDLLRVGRELRAGLLPGRGRDLARYGRLA
jgi:hypothetical protein